MRILVLLVFLFVSAASATAGAVCKNGSVMPAAVRKAAAGLPVSARVPMNVGSRLPPNIRTVALPKLLGRILPQYPGYRAVRTHRTVVIVDPRSRRIAYLLPLDLPQPLDCPDS